MIEMSSFFLRFKLSGIYFYLIFLPCMKERKSNKRANEEAGGKRRRKSKEAT
jgi:hypothetical protein